ncbi:MAG: GreA/GreB family elongation factor [Archangium sp.]
MKKEALKKELLEVLNKTLEQLLAAHADTHEAATHEEAKPENDKDTRALEQSYLARGQAMRIEALKAGIAATGVMSIAKSDAARAGSLLELEDEDGETVRYFLAPEGGGTKLKGGVQVVTPVSPLGAAFMGKREGEDVELKLAGKSRQWAVTKVT